MCDNQIIGISTLIFFIKILINKNAKLKSKNRNLAIGFTLIYKGWIYICKF